MFLVFIAQVINLLIFGGLSIWAIIFVGKILAKKKKNKELLKSLINIELTFKKIIKKSWKILNSLIVMFICVFLAIASQPLIYKLNYQLGEGYSIFASYMLAILLWIIIRGNKNAFE